MDKRGFLGSMLALGMAPAIVRASSLMKIVVPTTEEVIAINGLYWVSGDVMLTRTMITRESLRILERNLIGLV